MRVTSWTSLGFVVDGAAAPRLTAITRRSESHGRLISNTVRAHSIESAKLDLAEPFRPAETVRPGSGFTRIGARVLSHFDVGHDRRQQIMAIARDAQKRGWWEHQAKQIGPRPPETRIGRGLCWHPCLPNLGDQFRPPQRDDRSP
jgi:hypothetical protein